MTYGGLHLSASPHHDHPSHRVLILVLSCETPPYDALYAAQRATWGSVKVEGVKTSSYWCDDLPSMTERLRQSLDALMHASWTHIFRTNSSSYVDKAALLRKAESLPLERCYCGLDGGGFASGSGFFLSRDVAEILARDLPTEPQTEIEDVVIGKTLARAGVGVTPGAARSDYWHLKFLEGIGHVTGAAVESELRAAYHIRCKPPAGAGRSLDAEAMRAVHALKH